MFKKRVVTIFIFLLGTYLIINLSRSIWELWHKEERVFEGERKITQLKKEGEELERKLELRQSPEFLEREAREKLSMVRSGETIVILPPLPSSEASPTQPLPNWQKWWQLFF